MINPTTIIELKGLFPPFQVIRLLIELPKMIKERLKQTIKCAPFAYVLGVEIWLMARISQSLVTFNKVCDERKSNLDHFEQCLSMTLTR